MSPASLDGIPPTGVTMPTRSVPRTIFLLVWLLAVATAPAQEAGTPAPEPASDASESSSRSVPEPDTLVLFAAGATLLVLYHVQRRRRGERPTTA